MMLAGMAAYTVLAGADFGAGLWMLLAAGPGAPRIRAAARHAMGPVWEANHVWLIFVLVVGWTNYPVAYGSIASTLALPLTAAAVGIIFRGAAYALRGQGASRAAETVLALSSVLTPFALGTVIGAIATGRVPAGNAAGNLVTTWLSPAPVLTGVLAVAFSGFLAAVFLAADSRRLASAPGSPPGSAELVAIFRRRALAAGAVAGALALAGLLVMRGAGLDLTHGAALAMVGVSAAGGLATIGLCWRSRFGLARAGAAVAVAAVVAGWAAAQAPRLLPGLTVTAAAAGQATLVATTIAVGVGLVVLLPALGLLYGLFLRGRLDAPDAPHVPGAVLAPVRPGAPAPFSPAEAGAAGAKAAGAKAAGAGDVPGAAEKPTAANAAGARPAPATETGGMPAAVAPAGAALPAGTTASARTGPAGPSAAAPGTGTTGTGTTGTGTTGTGTTGAGTTGAGTTGTGARPSARLNGALAVAGLVAGTGLLVFSDAAWALGLGVALLVLCAVTVFRLSAGHEDG
jgi:cytochrome d ubiquinol oxidase subunit II